MPSEAPVTRGNYGLENSLSAGRAEDRAAKRAANESSR